MKIWFCYQKKINVLNDSVFFIDPIKKINIPILYSKATIVTSLFINLKELQNNLSSDFLESRVSDHSGIEALSNLVEKYEAAGKEVRLKHLSADCKKILFKSSPKFRTVIETDVDDPRYFVLAQD